MNHQRPTSQFDAIVVGAGIAGCAAAVTLAELGCRVALVDRRDTGRPKTCGHCLSPRAEGALRALGLRDLVGDLAEAGHRTVRIETSGRHLTLPMRQPGIVIRRDRLDPALRARAREHGVEFLDRHRVVAVDGPDSTDDDGGHGAMRTVHLQRTSYPGGGRGCDMAPLRVRTALIVGADGLGSAVARCTGLAIEAQATSIGVSFDLPASEAASWPPEILPMATPFGQGEVRMHVGRAGYVGLVRESDGRVHAAALLRQRDGRGIDVDAALAELLGNRVDRAALASLRRVGASPMPWRPRSVAEVGVALVGDAAGYAEPFTGEGMTWAFESAALLGAVVKANGARRFDMTAARDYAQRWHRTVGTAQRRCARVGWLLRHPRALGLAAAVAPRLASAIGAVVAQRVNRPDWRPDWRPEGLGPAAVAQ